MATNKTSANRKTSNKKNEVKNKNEKNKQNSITKKTLDNKDIVKEKNIKYLFITFIISLFLGLLTPIGTIPYTYVIKIMQGNTMEFIDEHKALVLVENLFVVGYLGILLVTLICLLIMLKTIFFINFMVYYYTEEVINYAYKYW